MKLLLRLWWLQQRRDFSWKDAAVGVYILFIYGCVAFGAYEGYAEKGGVLSADSISPNMGAYLAVGLLLPDILFKLVMKRDVTAMDDYLKSRPIPERLWDRFLLLTNLTSIWNYALPLLFLPLLCWLMSLPQAIATFLLLLVFSMVDGIFITTYRKANCWMLKWPLWIGWMGMFIVATSFVSLFSWAPPVRLNIGLLVLAAMVVGGLTVYLYHLKNYNEKKQKSSRVHNFGKTTLFNLQLLGTLRAKRIRTMVLVVTLVFLLDAYMMAFLPGEEGSVNRVSLIVYVVGVILLPSMLFSQWTFGIEANFFHGLMTKPVTVRQLLQNCYYFYLMVSAAATLLTVPFLFISDEITLFTLAGGYSTAVFMNLCNMPTSLFSSRLDLFASSLFNYQGANMKINVYSIAFMIPIALLAGIYWLWGATAWALVSIALAVISIAVHRPVLGKIADLFNARKYQRMEKFME